MIIKMKRGKVMKRKGSLIAFLLLFSVVLSLITPAQTVKAGGPMGPVVNEAIVTARIKKIVKALGVNDGDLSAGNGCYFTANGQKCTHAMTDVCENCLNVNVIKSKWFIDAIGGQIKSQYLPAHYYTDGKLRTTSGYTCYGFANVVLYLIAMGENDFNTDVYPNRIGQAQMDFSIQKMKDIDVRIGDVVRVDNHSFIFLYYIDDNSIMVLDDNYVEKNRVAIHSIDTSKKYTNSKMAVTRARNYEPDAEVELWTEWMTEPQPQYAGLEYETKIETKYRYASYLWYGPSSTSSTVTYRTASFRRVPAGWTLNKVVTSNSYSGARNGKYNVRYSAELDAPVPMSNTNGWDVDGVKYWQEDIIERVLYRYNLAS